MKTKKMKGKLVFLGTSSAIPTKERNNPGIYFQFFNNFFLFDCGEGIQRQLIKANINFNKIQKIFISHFHGDHVLGLPGLLQTFDFHQKKEIQIIGPKGISEVIENIKNLSYFDNSTKINILQFDCSNELKTIFDEKNYLIKTIKLNHSIDCVAYSFEQKEYFKYSKQKIKEFNLNNQDFVNLEKKGFTIKNGRKIYKEDIGEIKKGFKFCYISDTYKTENIFKIAENSDYLVIECTYFDEEELAEEYKHLTLYYILENYEKFKEIGVKKIILTHFSQRYKNLERYLNEIKKRKIEDIILARDFLEILIK